MALTKRVHDWRTVIGKAQKKERKLVGKHPYARFVHQGSPPVYVQAGQFYGEGGDPIPAKQIPAWVKEQIELLSPEGKRLYGLAQKERDAA